jgi:hypothetical protein
MKNIFFVVAIFTLAGFSNCEKNPLPPSPPDITVNPPVIELGKSFVLKNSEEWEVPFNAWFHSNPSRFQLRAEILYSNLVRESFFLHDIPCKKGIYGIEYFNYFTFNNSIPEALFVATYEFDQPVGDYYIDTTRTDHFVEILEYDSIKHTVQGRFQMFLGKDPSSISFPGVPDSIFLTEGKFNLRIQEP